MVLLKLVDRIPAAGTETAVPLINIKEKLMA